MPVVKNKVDCPDCHAPARAREHSDTSTNPPTSLGVECEDCGYDTTGAASPPAADSPSDQSRAQRQGDEGWPRHEGAGWYTLSNGDKVRGKDEAASAQADLDK